MSTRLVKSKIARPEHWGEPVLIPINHNKDPNANLNDSITVTQYPTIDKRDITLYKTKKGRYLAKPRGVGLTKIEKAHGYKRTRGKTAEFIKDILSKDPQADIRRIGTKNTRLQKWKVDKDIHYFDVKTNVSHIFKSDGKKRELDPIRTILSDIGQCGWVGARGVDMLTSQYDMLTPKQKEKLMLLMNEVDWDAFFAEYIDSDGSGHKKSNHNDEVDRAKQKEGYELVQSLIDEVKA